MILGVVSTFLISVVVVSIAASQPPIPQAWPTLEATTTPNPATVDQLKTLVKRYYELTGNAARTFDVSQFPTILVDDPKISLDTWQVETMAKAHAQGTGMLSYALTFFGNWKQGAEKLEQLEATAKAQGRDLTRQELQIVSDSSAVPAPRRTDPMYLPMLTYQNFVVANNQAEVVFDDGGQTLKFFCVNTKDGWKIAGMRVLSTHV
jgi:hypothetical protein